MTLRRPDPDVVRALQAAGLSRRDFLRRVGAGGATLAAGSFLAACGIGGAGNNNAGGGDPSAGASAPPADLGEVGGNLNISNWTEYIDVEGRGGKQRSPTLDQFEKKHDVKVKYTEDVNDNNSFFAKIRGQLQADEPTGRDIVVLTDWMAARMINLGWLEPLVHDRIPNMENLVSGLQDVEFDPGRKFSLPWQSGITGIGYNPKLVGKKITAVEDLFDPALAGKVTFLTEMRDTMGLIMASMGFDPVNHEFSEYEQAIEKMQKAVDDGQVRAFTGNDYVADLAAGNIGAAIAWSGDVIQSQFENPDIEWVLPAEGGLLWSDNMLIPANAENLANAHAFMDFVYDPAIAAQIAAWVNYITPVEGAKAEIAKIDKSLVNNELIFPTAKTLDQTFEFKNLDEAEEKQYEELFQGVIGA